MRFRGGPGLGGRLQGWAARHSKHVRRPAGCGGGGTYKMPPWPCIMHDAASCSANSSHLWHPPDHVGRRHDPSTRPCPQMLLYLVLLLLPPSSPPLTSTSRCASGLPCSLMESWCRVTVTKLEALDGICSRFDCLAARVAGSMFSSPRCVHARQCRRRAMGCAAPTVAFGTERQTDRQLMVSSILVEEQARALCGSSCSRKRTPPHQPAAAVPCRGSCHVACYYHASDTMQTYE